MLERAPHARGHTSCSDSPGPSDGRASVYAGSSLVGAASGVASDAAGSPAGTGSRVSSSGSECSEAVSEAAVDGCCCAGFGLG